MDCLTEALREPHGAHVIRIGHEHNELIPAETTEGVLGADELPHHGGQMENRPVADGVAVGVIDELEIVEIDGDTGKLLVVTFCRGQPVGREKRITERRLRIPVRGSVSASFRMTSWVCSAESRKNPTVSSAGEIARTWVPRRLPGPVGNPLFAELAVGGRDGDSCKRNQNHGEKGQAHGEDMGRWSVLPLLGALDERDGPRNDRDRREDEDSPRRIPANDFGDVKSDGADEDAGENDQKRESSFEQARDRQSETDKPNAKKRLPITSDQKTGVDSRVRRERR